MKDDMFSWVFLLCACIILILVCGVLSIFSIFYVTLIATFGADKIVVAWIGSVAYGLSGITSPLTSLIISRFGSRLAVMTGCTLCAASLILSAFVTRVELLFVTFSVMFGFGNSLVYTTSICQLGDKFNRYLPVATGIMVSSTGLGMLILSPLSFALISQLGWRQTLIVLSGITALTTLGTISYAPKQTIASLSQDHGSTYTSPVQVEPPRNDIFTTVKHIWGNRRFLVFIISTACVEFGNSIPFMFLVPFATQDVGVSEEVSAYVLMASGGAKAVGRVLFGKLISCPCLLRFKRLSFHQMALIVSGAGYLTLPRVNSLPLLLAYMITMSFVESCSAVLMPHLLTQVVGERSKVFGWGFLCCTNAIFFMIGPPIAGMISDKQQTFTSAFYFSGSSILLGALVLFFIAGRRQLAAESHDRPITTSTIQEQSSNVGTCFDLSPVSHRDNDDNGLTSSSLSSQPERRKSSIFSKPLLNNLDLQRCGRRTAAATAAVAVGNPQGWKKNDAKVQSWALSDNSITDCSEWQPTTRTTWSRRTTLSAWHNSDCIPREIQRRSMPKSARKAVGLVTSTSSAMVYDSLSSYEKVNLRTLRPRKSQSCSEIEVVRLGLAD